MTTTLVILAATMGNKYGGLKQPEGIGPSGETILDYSVYDAIQAGFNRIIFVISRYFSESFVEQIASKYEGEVQIEYVYQEIDSVSEADKNPKRALLWGSAHAILMAREVAKEPFGVINAVNFYQRESFQLLYAHLQQIRTSFHQYFMISYKLKNVLPKAGSVTRGICEVDEKKQLVSIVDRQGVERVSGEPMYPNEYSQWEALSEQIPVSMNMWGFTPDIFEHIETCFQRFIQVKGMDLNAHLSIPYVINQMINEGLVVQTLPTDARWMGLVSPDDRIQVILRINEMIRKGVYPQRLFKQTIF